MLFRCLGHVWECCFPRFSQCFFSVVERIGGSRGFGLDFVEILLRFGWILLVKGLLAMKREN